jgi:malonyl-CoA O-methyltransferase
MKIRDTYGLPQPRLTQRRFDAAAATFDTADAVHGEARERLLERLALFALAPVSIVDLGAATGSASLGLACRYPDALVVAADLSFAMTDQAERKRGADDSIAPLQCDAEALPLCDASVDLVFSNLLLPWISPEGFFAECARVLRPGGLVLFTTLGPDTLVELRRAWAASDDRIHVHGFIDMHDIGDLAMRAGLAEPVMDVDRLEVRYPSLAALIADLRATGSSNSAVGRREGLTSRGRWRAFETALTANVGAGGPRVTVELVYGQAFGVGRRASAVSGEGVVRIAAEELARTGRRGRTENS